MNAIQNAVSRAVASSGVTKDALARMLGISRTSLYSKMRGANEFTLTEAHRLSSILGCTIDELYELTRG